MPKADTKVFSIHAVTADELQCYCYNILTTIPLHSEA